MSRRPMPPSMKRYTIRLTAMMTLYFFALIGANMWFRHAPPSGVLAWFVASLPALPIIGVFVVIGRLLVEMEDEYMRARFVQQSLIATAFALSVATVWGFLEDFGLVGHAPGYYAAVLWFAGLGMGACVTRLLDRRAAR